MITFKEVEQIIAARIQTFTRLSADRFQSPNRPLSGDGAFTIPQDGAWAAWRIDYGQSFISCLADEPLTRRVGELSFYVHVPRGWGTSDLNEICEALAQHFDYYTISHFETLSASMLPAAYDEKWYQARVVIAFRAG